MLKPNSVSTTKNKSSSAAVLLCFFCTQGAPKSKPSSFCHNCVKCWHLQNSYPGTLSSKSAIVRVLNILPHLKCIATLSCEILLSAFDIYLHGIVVISWLEASMGRTPKTWLKQITADTDTTAADAFQLAADHPTWTAVATAAWISAQSWRWWM